IDASRRSSPQTPILIWNDALYGKSAQHRAEVTQKLEQQEVAEDWSAREWEAFCRADLAIVRHPRDEAWIRWNNLTVETAIVTPCVAGPRMREWKERSGILLIVDLTQPGDVDAFAWFLEKIWPTICQESADIELLVAGADKLALETRQKLSRTKWLANDREPLAINARCFIAPLRFGRVPDHFAHLVARGVPGI